MENEVFFLLPQKRKASQWDAFRFSDNPCFNFAKHKLSSISIMNLFAVIKIDLPQFLQIFLANKHYIIVCKGEVLIHSFDVVHIHKEALGHRRKHGAVSSCSISPSFLYNVYVFCPA